ncbi:jg6517 [Pararge aegeria aegeria]|uniref:Jg6517 protein n=2 Tax=Pararge aegeria TaxID=116150 RepID=A0A8S4SB92_9NEOP|nr:jg6517 [Pararge aegeria aegeria]
MATNNVPDMTPQKEQEMEKHIGELESVGTEEELEKKLNSMSKFGFSIASWMKYIFNKDNDGNFKAEWLTIDEYTAMAEESMQNAFKTIHLPNWRLEKRGSQKGDIVESTQTEQFGKVYRFTGIVDCPAKFLYEEFKDNLTKLPEWNPTILKSELIKHPVWSSHDIKHVSGPNWMLKEKNRLHWLSLEEALTLK